MSYDVIAANIKIINMYNLYYYIKKRALSLKIIRFSRTTAEC